MKKQVFSFFAAFIILVSALTPLESFALATSKYTPPFELDAKGVFLINMDTNEVIYEKNSSEKMYPASTTKIMTAILALELVPDLEHTEVTMKSYIQNEMYIKNMESMKLYGGGISLGGFLQGETITMDKLLYAALLPSANEAAMMIADYVGDGSVDYFVELMNKKAQELGAVNTHFTNPHGLHDPDHYTTPYDMYLIAKYAMQNPTFVKIVNTTSYDGGPTNIHDTLQWNGTNSMIKKSSQYYSPYVSGIKTGTTEEAGGCFISSASKDGYNYMMVMMGCPTELVNEQNVRFYETKKLYDWVFTTFKVKTIMEKGEILAETGLRLAKDSKKDHIKLMSGDRITALVPDEIDVTSVITTFEVPKMVNSPVKKGDLIGSASFILAGETIGSVPLVAAENVEASTIKIYLDKVFGLTETFWFKFAVIFSVTIVISYSILLVLQNKRSKRAYK
ncbi:MAG: D-alanyl-D-alanine carboxypeptidase family protein [Oscillospiraceae bacterium]